MARKVRNLLGLAVLAAVAERPMHPYEMATVIRERGKERDMGLKWGSLYTVVGNLHRHGFIEVAENARDGARPERTVYRITGDGRRELQDWVRELIAVPVHEPPRFEAGLSVWVALDPDEVIGLLRQRLARLDEENAAQRAALEAHRRQVPRMFLVEAEYDLALREADAEFTRGLLDELARGAFPDLRQWRDWHAEGGDLTGN
ncbi:PadR family transcriptional regulator [Pseudonocardia cypriaca]|uniref:PadR family transcriptional regulator n=1 Tax=Pseudonocardia cypriaca TaxID=882449 RepID=A0A543GHY3_9PSEU|nr:PadR family transcriptional regulator [Pseudonocardia cypriaca]TQM45679.1 PadR family transcriptional regulator [Pseudonocardia cypriaca]